MTVATSASLRYALELINPNTANSSPNVGVTLNTGIDICMAQA
jgi:hypothetical protein